MQRRRRSRALLVSAVVCMAAVWLVPRRAPATIAEQRARLPPAAECADETVAGIWRSHTFTPQRREWYVFTLYVRRAPNDPSQLTGRITSHYWRGGAEDSEPPPCARESYQMTVSFDARGSVSPSGTIEFGGYGSWRMDQSPCGRQAFGYNLDHFSGVIDPSILEFQSVNNDGGSAVNEPTVFRRIRCPPVQSAEAPSVNTVPPSFYPDRGGCGFGL
ncbi:MAG: hypothetical protein AB8I08_25815 [Sandaracinaceae bacterium]